MVDTKEDQKISIETQEMIKIILPEQFETTVWKNGKGKTLQLAISDGGSIDGFDWRLSIASVVEDGIFSDFSGYERNLILLEGDGIALNHNDTRNGSIKSDVLKKPLSISRFLGSDQTEGKLLAGPIKDFNVMTKLGKYKVSVEAYVEKQSVNISPSKLCFIYSNKNSLVIKTTNQVYLEANHLMQVTDCNDEISVEGSEFFIVALDEHNTHDDHDVCEEIS